MAIKFEELQSILESYFPDSTIYLEDMLGDEDHYGVTIESASFNGMSKVKRHQEVYKALGNKMGNELHALSIKTITPEEKLLGE